jgi:murein DD-endopeptidase MepM/ murein hydrolase activator NlpD
VTRLSLEEIMAVPVPGAEVTYAYGEINDGYSAGYHTGEDYACAVGSRIVAAAAGRVVETSESGGTWGSDYGKIIVIESNETGPTCRHGYCHLSHIGVQEGERVREGERIGRAGQTGNTTGAHLHYEERTDPFRYNNKDRDPEFSHDGDRPNSPWSEGDVYISKLHFGQQNSDSVKRLQFRLRHHQTAEAASKRLAITGNWGVQTRDAVRKWQRHVADEGRNDGMSVPPFQARRLFGDRYDVHE